MSTRSLIARKTAKGFSSRYHHWDGYPSGVGQALYDLYNTHFKGELPHMMNILIDKHKAGWSNICDADWMQEPGFVERIKPDSMTWDEYNDLPIHKRPQCYCHGDRHEKPTALITMQSESNWGAEYAYAIDEKTAMMDIYAWQWEGKQWMHRHTIDLNGNAPEWDTLD